MRTLHEFVAPFLTSAHDPFPMPPTADAPPIINNDDDQHNPHNSADLAILVNSLAASPLPHPDSPPLEDAHVSHRASPPLPSAGAANDSDPDRKPDTQQSHSPSVSQQAQMAIQTILATAQRKAASGAQAAVWPLASVPTLVPPVDQAPNGQPSSSKRRLEDASDDDPHAKIRRTVHDHVQNRDGGRLVNMTTVVCLHAAVAQKSYGSEKRFLCPPPIVRVEGPFGNIRNQKLSMCIISENGERAPEAVVPLEANMTASFKFLHVTGTAKAKSFNLSLEITPPLSAGVTIPEGETRPRPWAVFESAPVTIISKPSKKTAKTRNISSCILAGGPVSLFNRINSQTVRTKYMTIDHANLCASNVSWSAFNVNVIRRPQDAGPVAGPQPVTYGSEIILSDSITGIATSPLIIRKVDKGKISMEDGGPVSQMQKIALQRLNPDGTRHYLSAAGPVPGTPGVVAPSTPGSTASQAGIHQLLFQPPRIREEIKDSLRIVHDEVDDYLCWTIVGISKFQYTFFDALGQNNKIPDLPITPFPTLFQPPIYRPANNTLELTVSSFFYENPKTGHHSQLEIWLGEIGPLQQRICNAPPTGPLTNISPFYGPQHGQGPLTADCASPMASLDPSGTAPNPQLVTGPPRFIGSGPYHTNVMVDLPPVQEIVKALQEEAQRAEGRKTPEEKVRTNGSSATVEAPLNISAQSLPLLFIRGLDGVGYHSGRTITCENVFQGIDLANPAANGAADPAWLAAAQAAASSDGALHGWTIRVL